MGVRRIPPDFRAEGLYKKGGSPSPIGPVPQRQLVAGLWVGWEPAAEDAATDSSSPVLPSPLLSEPEDFVTLFNSKKASRRK